MSWRPTLFAAAWIAGIAVWLPIQSTVWAQDSKPDPDRSAKLTTENETIDGHPGFFDFAKLNLFEQQDLEMHISVKGPLLALVAAASRDAEPDLSDTLGRLKGIEVRVYTLAEKRRPKARDLLDEIADGLRKQGWQSAITVQVQRDHGYAFLRYRGEHPIGLAAMYITDENQAVFVNIVGKMDMATIGRLARRFDLDLLAVTEDDP